MLSDENRQWRDYYAKTINIKESTTYTNTHIKFPIYRMCILTKEEYYDVLSCKDVSDLQYNILTSPSKLKQTNK